MGEIVTGTPKPSSITIEVLAEVDKACGDKLSHGLHEVSSVQELMQELNAPDSGPCQPTSPAGS